MKKILLLLCLIPMITFSQVSSWRGSSSNVLQSSVPMMNQRSSDISSWRNSTPREYNRPRDTKSGSNIIVNNNPWLFNDWGWNRWNMWGAPMVGWNFWTPTWYINDWGYRQPARIYVYENGKKDTIRGKKPIINFGLHLTSNNQMGAFFTIGNKGYFVMDFNTTYERDKSTFFPYGTIDRVDFPLMSDLVKQRSIYVGVGKRIKRTGIHTMFGFANERILWRGYDEIGQITFPKSNQNFMTFKVGVMRDFKNLTYKMDYDPVIKYGQFGLGFNF